MPVGGFPLHPRRANHPPLAESSLFWPFYRNWRRRKTAKGPRDRCEMICLKEPARSKPSGGSCVAIMGAKVEIHGQASLQPPPAPHPPPLCQKKFFLFSPSTSSYQADLRVAPSKGAYLYHAGYDCIQGFENRLLDNLLHLLGK